jgi:amino acid adenylation domain-containing protein
MNDIIDLKKHYGTKGAEEIMLLDDTYNHTTPQGNCGGQHHIRFDEYMHEKLRFFAERHNTSSFFTLLTAFRVLLLRYNFQDGFYVREEGGERLPGSTNSIHAGCDGDITFLDLLADTEALYSKLVCAQSTDNFLSYAFVFRHTAKKPYATVSPSPGAINISRLKLTFFISQSTALSGFIRYDSGIYSEGAIEKMEAHFRHLLYSAICQPMQKTGLLPMLGKAENYELLHTFNETVRPVPDKTVVDLFEERSAAAPGNIALYSGDQSITYGEVNEKANQLARFLISKGVQANDNVGLLVDRGFDMIIGMYAILKCGAAYVPIPPDYPSERQLHILDSSAVRYVLTHFGNPYRGMRNDVETIDIRSAEIERFDRDNPGVEIDGAQLAYTIYTSGSTGMPKGVMVEHRSVVNLITWVNSEFNVTSSDCLLFITSIGFDLSVYDVFGIMAAGGSIVIASKEEVRDIPSLAGLMQRYPITFWDSVPSTLNLLVNYLGLSDAGYRQDALRLVFLSGDWIPVDLPDKVKGYFANAEVISLGGATEGTVWSNFYRIGTVDRAWKSIPYGVPIANNAFYILNDQLQPVPEGVVGELFIGGIGVARGYSGNKQNSERSFVTDPFTNRWGGKMYRTGDLGRMLPQKVMEFVGRKDNQLKIRGYRVEPGEIECVLKQFEKVSNAVVLATDDKKQLVCYLVPGKYYDRDAVIAMLKEKLPEYMIPGKWVEIDAVPLTANGKTDTKALLGLMSKQHKSEFIAPRNELEKTVASIWQMVLGIEEVGMYDNFFDVGGHSLLAVELITDMEKALERDIPVNILYKYPTISDLCSFLGNNEEHKKWKYLLTIKSSGSKTPVYIVHGNGLSLSNFHNLAEYVDPEQPVFSLQPVGLDGTEAPLENISDIARYYISEILAFDPAGPYALGGYSFGGYIAIEMKRQLEAMGRTVKMIAIFDTDAELLTYKKDWRTTLPKRLKRQVPKFLFIARSMFTQPVPTAKYQYTLFSKKITDLCYSLGIKEKPALTGVNRNISKIDEVSMKAFRNYQLTPFNDKVYLFKAKSRMYFVDDFEHLGWTSYAQKGVAVYEVPVDHRTMFMPPNVSELGKMLQFALDHC